MSATESFSRCVAVEIEILDPMQAVGRFRRPQFLVPEPPSRGEGAAQKINREKSCGSPKSQLLGAYGCRNTAIFVSKSGIPPCRNTAIFVSKWGKPPSQIGVLGQWGGPHIHTDF